jgi:hypothetical protein
MKEDHFEKACDYINKYLESKGWTLSIETFQMVDPISTAHYPVVEALIIQGNRDLIERVKHEKETEQRNKTSINKS